MKWTVVGVSGTSFKHAGTSYEIVLWSAPVSKNACITFCSLLSLTSIIGKGVSGCLDDLERLFCSVLISFQGWVAHGWTFVYELSDKLKTVLGKVGKIPFPHRKSNPFLQEYSFSKLKKFEKGFLSMSNNQVMLDQT